MMLLDDWVRSKIGKYPIHGLSLAVADRGEVSRVYTYGFSDVRRRRGVTPSTLFQAASISKPVAATAAMIGGAQRRELALDAPIARALPDWRVCNPFDEPVTLRRLMAHTSGMVGDRYGTDDPNRPLPSAAAQIGDPCFPSTIVREPGSAYVYSPHGYAVLQAAMERSYAEPFARTMRRLVLEPFGMASSTFEPVSAEVADGSVALPYDSEAFDRGEQRPISNPPPAYRALASGGLWTTPSDLARFLSGFQTALSGSPIGDLTPELAAEMVGCELGFTANVGRGFRRCFGHTGHNAGYLSLMLGSVDCRKGVVIMTNSGPPMEFSGEYRAFHFINELAEFLIEQAGWAE